MIFDTHAHYDDDAFDGDRDKVIDDLIKSDVKKIVNVGANLATSLNSIELAHKYDFFYASS